MSSRKQAKQAQRMRAHLDSKLRAKIKPLSKKIHAKIREKVKVKQGQKGQITAKSFKELNEMLKEEQLLKAGKVK